MGISLTEVSSAGMIRSIPIAGTSITSSKFEAPFGQAIKFIPDNELQPS